MNYVAPGLDILATAVILVDERQVMHHLNPAAENMFGVSAHHAIGRPLADLFGQNKILFKALDSALTQGASFTEHELNVAINGHQLQLSCTITPLEFEVGAAALEFHPVGGSMKIAREEQALAQAQASQTLLRQLAHEIRNPLGGIRGAAQLLEAELDAPNLAEYTQVIIKETDRLQGLLDRMLTPAKRPNIQSVNIHEAIERVRSLLLAEFPELTVRRDYDLSLPDIQADPEQLIQAMLNIARNAAQAMQGKGDIQFRTRIARQVTLAMKRWKLAMRIEIIDNGPGIPEDLHDKLFFPLISGRDGGTGLGLTLAQNLVQRHEGAIYMESAPGHTCFSILLPIKS
jgi:two-component system nitrogen regulation sensor histidine kinase GlnL